MKLKSILKEEQAFSDEHYIDTSDRLREILARYRKNRRGLLDALTAFMMQEKEYAYRMGHEDGKFALKDEEPSASMYQREKDLPMFLKRQAD